MDFLELIRMNQTGKKWLEKKKKKLLISPHTNKTCKPAENRELISQMILWIDLDAAIPKLIQFWLIPTLSPLLLTFSDELNNAYLCHPGPAGAQPDCSEVVYYGEHRKQS